jgi:hypothetical protein
MNYNVFFKEIKYTCKTDQDTSQRIIHDFISALKSKYRRIKRVGKHELLIEHERFGSFSWNDMAFEGRVTFGFVDGILTINIKVSQYFMIAFGALIIIVFGGAVILASNTGHKDKLFPLVFVTGFIFLVYRLNISTCANKVLEIFKKVAN